MYPSLWDSDAAPSVEQAEAIENRIAGDGNVVYIGGPEYAVDSFHPWTPELVAAYRAAGRKTFPMYVGRQSGALTALSDTAEATSQGCADGTEACSLLESFEYPLGTYVGNDYEISSEGETTSQKSFAYLVAWAKEVKEKGYRPVLYSGPSVIEWIWNSESEHSYEGVIVAEWIKAGFYNPNLNPYQIPSVPHNVFPNLRGWQYSNNYVANGIPEAGAWTVDNNVFDGKLLSSVPVVVPVPEPTPAPAPEPEEGTFVAKVNFPVTEYGSTGQAVRIVQGLLNVNGYDLATDGDFKEVTESAVKDFQAEVSIAIDGIVGPVTFGKLLSEA